ncbi:hypothetical protein V2L09_02315 [Pseudomonas alliivorans]|nr:hypothetical protein [Pseudomonas alliivorans]
MSNEFKLVRVSSQGVQFGNAWFSHEGITGYTAEQLNEGNCAVTGKAYMDWLAAAPQPLSLGGEPEALGWRLNGYNFNSERFALDYAKWLEGTDQLKYLIDRAHLAPLQAELTRMNAMFDGLATAVGFSKERCEQAGDSPLDCANQLKAEIERLKALSVTNIMLDVIPGDGDGHEVFAKSVREVEEAISTQCSALEDVADERDQLKARRDELEALLLLIRDQPALNPIHRARIKTIMSKPAGSEQV